MKKSDCPKCGGISAVSQPTPTKTVRVRIALAMNEHGEWSSAGWNNASDADMESELNNLYFAKGEPKAIDYIEADVPVPEVKTIEGRIARRELDG